MLKEKSNFKRIKDIIRKNPMKVVDILINEPEKKSNVRINMIFDKDYISFTVLDEGLFINFGKLLCTMREVILKLYGKNTIFNEKFLLTPGPNVWIERDGKHVGYDLNEWLIKGNEKEIPKSLPFIVYDIVQNPGKTGENYSKEFTPYAWELCI